MISGWTKTIFFERKKANHTHPSKLLILNNLSIARVENRLQLCFGFSFCPFNKDTPHPADSVQPQACCCLSSCQVQEGVPTLANSENFTPEGQFTACFPDPMASPGSIQNAFLCKQWGNKNFSPKSTLVKEVVRQPSQEAGPFLSTDCLSQVVNESVYCSAASHAFSL